jgi:hypothetical protein
MLKNLFYVAGWLACLLVVRPASAQVSAPSSGGNISIKQITATSTQLTIGLGGTGQGRVVAMAATSNGSSVRMPLDGKTFYTGSPVYGQGDKVGQGYIVYSGPDRTVTVTGLQPGTAYYFYNAEYNNDSSSIAYNTTGNSLIMRTRAAAAPTPLPVVLTTFTGTVDAQALATLRWTTASEYNTDYFILERSADGLEFSAVGRQAAAGTSSQAIIYQFADSRPLTAITYYRLRQADRDGSEHFSSIVTLAPVGSFAREVVVYPNPATSQAFQLALQGYDGEIISLRVLDALGRPVASQTLTPTDAHYAVSLGLPATLAPGTYMLTLLSSARLVRKQLIVIN